MGLSQYNAGLLRQRRGVCKVARGHFTALLERGEGNHADIRGFTSFAVSKCIHFATILFGGSRADTGGNRLCLRGHVNIKRLRLSRRSTPFRQRLNADHADLATLAKRQDVPAANRRCVLGYPFTVHLNVPVTDLACREAARLEEARLPQPAIEAIFGGALPYDLTLRAARAAKGLSGSILSVFSGWAE